MNKSKIRGLRSVRPWFAALLTAVLAAACGGDGATTSSNVDTVAAELVGLWEVPVVGGRWTLDIKSSGSYAFANEGSGAATAHGGTFTARDGEWTLRSATGIEDGGRYEILDDGGLELIGNRGAVRWTRGPQAGASAPAAVPPPAAVSAATRPNAAIPETIDPCLLVTAEEASRLLGVAVETQRETPQPRTQNDCVYRAQGRSFQVMSSNGGGLDPAGFIERRRATGGVPWSGVGDAAVITHGTAVTQVSFVVGTASVELVVPALSKDRAESALRPLAVQAAQRLTSPSAAYDMGGSDHFVGVWRVATHLYGGGNGPLDMIIEVKRGGELAVLTGGTVHGTLEIEGDGWRLQHPYYQSPPTGTYRVRGDALSLKGLDFDAELTRVACGKRPAFQAPYQIARDIEGQMRPTTRMRPQLRPPASQSLDARLVGFWEGAGTLRSDGDIPLKIHVAIDSRGYAVFALYPHASGTLEADDGNYTMHIDGRGDFAGTYELGGGTREGTIRMKDGDDTLEWLPTDPSARPVYASPFVVDCG
jgi:hypothetical protein